MVKDLMNEYYRMHLEAIEKGLFIASSVYSIAEDLTDSFSKSNPNNWVESLVKALTSNAELVSDQEEIDAYKNAIETAKILII